MKPELEAEISEYLNTIISRLKFCIAAYNTISGIDDNTDNGGFYKYKKIMSQFHQLFSPIFDFITSMRFFTTSTDLSADNIIEPTEAIIGQLIGLMSVKQDIQDAIFACNWKGYFPNLDIIFEKISKDLKGLLGSLIAICNNAGNEAHTELLIYLKDLATQLEYLDVFCAKIKDHNKKIIIQLQFYDDSKKLFYDNIAIYEELFNQAKCDMEGCRLFWHQFFFGLPYILRGKEGLEDESRFESQDHRHGTISFELSAIQKYNFFDKFTFKNDIWETFLDAYKEYLYERFQNLTTYTIFDKQKLIVKKMFDSACENDMDKVSECIYSDDLNYYLNSLLLHPFHKVKTMFEPSIFIKQITIGFLGILRRLLKVYFKKNVLK